MRFGLLGSLEMIDDSGRQVDVPGLRLRTLLAVLLTHPNTVLSRDALVDAVWSGRPPATAKHGLDVLLSRLRSLMAEGGTARVLTRAGGYLILLNRDELDVLRFEDAVDDARSAARTGDLPRAVDLLRRALAEWRGPAYGDLACVSFAVEEAMRLDDERCAALEDLFDYELRLDHHREVEPALESYVEAHPFRERACSALMLALYRSGRQSEALGVYREAARRLEEQGLDPGAELRRLHVAILRQEPALLEADGARPSGERPLTRYAYNRDVALAYQITGSGPFDVVYAPPFVTNVDLTWDVPTWAALLHRFGAFSRLIRFDKRGTGMSDRTGVAEPAVVAEDLRAVMDAALSREAAIIGASDAGPLAIQFTAAHPDRVWALVLWGTAPRTRWAPDYPWGLTDDDLEDAAPGTERLWTEPGRAEAFARSIGAADVVELASMWRHSASPGAIRALDRQDLDVDVRAALPAIDVPVLVLNRRDDASAPGSRFLTEHLARARHVEFPGSEHVMFGASHDFEPIAAEIERFLETAWAQHLERRDSPSPGRAVLHS